MGGYGGYSGSVNDGGMNGGLGPGAGSGGYRAATPNSKYVVPYYYYYFFGPSGLSSLSSVR